MVRDGYKKTEVGVIPKDWDIRPIGEVFKLINGCAFKPADWKEHGTPIIRIQNLNDPFAPFNYYQGSILERNRIEEGDILFAWSGTIGTSFGARIWNGPDGILNQHIFKVIADEQQVTRSFSLLAFNKVEGDIKNQAHGFKASFVHVKKSDLVKIKFPIPSLKEQRAITQALSDVDALIDGLQKLIAKKQNIKTAAMQQLLTGKIRLPGFGEGMGYRQTESGKIPEDWQFKKIGDAVSFSGGSQPPRSTFIHKKQSGYIRLIQIRDYKSDKDITYVPEIIAKKTCSIKDVMIGRYGPPIFQILRGIKGAYNVALIKAIPSALINREFMYYILKQKSLFVLIEKLSQRSSGQTGIELAALRDYPLPLPLLREQLAIAQVLSDMDKELEALQARLDKTCAIKQGMMQELLTGRTRLV